MGRQVKTFDEIIDSLYSNINNLRNIKNYIPFTEGKEMYDKSSDEVKLVFIEAIEAGDKKAIVKWFSSHKNLPLEDKSLIALRLQALILDIPYRTRMDKKTLIYYIEKVTKAKND